MHRTIWLALLTACLFETACPAHAQFSTLAENQASNAGPMCQALAQHLLDQRGSLAGIGPWKPLETVLRAQQDSFLNPDTGWESDSHSVISKVRDEFHASPDLLDLLKKLEDFPPGALTLHRLGQTSLYAMESIEGTAICSYFTFFSVVAGRAQTAEPPPVIVKNDGTNMCWTTHAWLGTVGGKPAFVVDDNSKDLESTFSITPYAKGSWGTECHVVARFSAGFKVAERFCGGINCDEAASTAKQLAVRYDADPKAQLGAPLTSQIEADIARLKAFAFAGRVEDQLPTFGSQAKSSYVGFNTQAIIFPVILDGQTLLARLGHGTIGWRTSPDYLFALYRSKGGNFEPVAGFRIEKTRATLLGAEAQ
jgi:hypothetical protein